MSKLKVIILAAGKGTRMHSDLPKVLHQLGHKSLIQHVIDSARQLAASQLYVVYGHGKAQLQAALAAQNVELILQAEQLGTGHAVQQAIPYINDDDDVLILYGDVPLIAPQTLQRLINSKPAQGMAMLTVNLADPTGYGRIIRSNGQICGIVEQKDATPEELAITEVNTGIMLVPGQALKQWLTQLNNHNQQQEYYLTDIVAMAYQAGYAIASTQPESIYEVEGVNNRLQLATLERLYQQQQAKQLLLAGVTLRDPARFDLRGQLLHGKDVIIDSNVIIEGTVTLGDRVQIGAGCILKDCTIEADCVISPYSVIEQSHLAASCTVGPFARLRPGNYLAEAAHIGNFVEMKKTTLGQGSKAGHLSYLGDSEIGANVNIGAGTITCNYDGANKFKTIIEDDVFIGSDTQLIAPVTVAKGATIGAGTTVTRDVKQDELVISRVKQQHIQGWQRPKKSSAK